MAFVALAMIAVVGWEYPPALLVLLIALFLGRRAWRKHLEWVARARAEMEAAREDDNPA